VSVDMADPDTREVSVGAAKKRGPKAKKKEVQL
jgi:hypothetical protein